MTTTTTPPTADLRAEQGRLEQERRVLGAVAEVRAMRGRHDMGNRGDGPLQGVGVEYDGTVTGLPGIATTEDAVLRLTAVDERLAEIDALLPAAEQREEAARERNRQREAAEAERRVEAAVQAAREAAATVADAEAAVARARQEWNNDIAASLLGAVLGATAARRQAADAFWHAVRTAGGEQAQQRVLDDLGEAATMARRALPGHHPAALPPAEPAPLEYGWLIDALLNLPSLSASVADLNLRAAQQDRR